tara:strand:+ start:1338 stop:2099 length:762 start_codon:yes stop_codon:yes gene_type:complete
MTSPTLVQTARIAGLTALMLSTAACNTLSRLSEVGSQPSLAEIENPTQQANYKPVSLPMPQPEIARHNSNSLWRPGARAFFKDQRAAKVGDILTVTVSIADSVTTQNKTELNRTAGENAGLDQFLGYQNALGRILPESITPASAIDFDSQHVSNGEGKITRNETVSVQLAAIVTQVLPNGNLVVHGRQEVGLNYDVREIIVDGVIRPEDITASNQISHDKIAEARIRYGGRGQIMDLQSPRWGQQIYDIIFPF